MTASFIRALIVFNARPQPWRADYLTYQTTDPPSIFVAL